MRDKKRAKKNVPTARQEATVVPAESVRAPCRKAGNTNCRTTAPTGCHVPPVLPDRRVGEAFSLAEERGICHETCALYLRVSTVDQHPETQVLDLRQLAAQRGFQIVQEYTDTSAARRPAARAWIS